MAIILLHMLKPKALKSISLLPFHSLFIYNPSENPSDCFSHSSRTKILLIMSSPLLVSHHCLDDFHGSLNGVSTYSVFSIYQAE
jgi:hypothetical protein